MTEAPIVWNKPSGISCFPYRKDPSRRCVLQDLYEQFPEQKGEWPQGFDGGIAHRLDVPTSGQLLVARTVAQLQNLRTDFAEKKLNKRYLFLTAKQVSWRKHTIAFPIAHHPKNKRKMVVQRGANTPHRGKWYPARTHFQLLRSGSTPSGQELFLWEAKMRTGVMHQIRLHSAIAGIALVGDRLYGGGITPRSFPSDFALHHCGIESKDWLVSPVSVPEWWPNWAQS